MITDRMIADLRARMVRQAAQARRQAAKNAVDRFAARVEAAQS